VNTILNGDGIVLDQILAPLNAVGILLIQLAQDFLDSLQGSKCCLYPQVSASDARFACITC